MISHEGFRIIRSTSLGVSSINCTDALVAYQPDIKYKIEKKNAHNPAIIIRRGAYHDDTITCEPFLSPDEYTDLLAFLSSDTKFYIEFLSDSQPVQLPVTVSKLPEQDDAAREFDSLYKIQFKSIYSEHSPINFDAALGYGNSYGNSYGF